MGKTPTSGTLLRKTLKIMKNQGKPRNNQEKCPKCMKNYL